MTAQNGPRTNRELALDAQGRILNSELEKKGWKMSDLSRESGVPLYTISRAVNGHTLLRSQSARQIGTALGININELLQVERRAAPHEIPEGIHTETLEDGTIRIRANARVQKGVAMALLTLFDHDEPITPRRLQMLLNALYSPLSTDNKST